ncbi:hypothetical protein [Cupriavidus sp. IDO]|uniref:hypothetical protein n=1 Tax=Cupriavidus sp. IDO TaxID=1539142 RepID=UPI0005797703|nr:hypothetical protein [Cupriavidus sp. IDO]KWR89939.1 hypothetical protein RM96_12125 [Cupriavidus sp. IDO]
MIRTRMLIPAIAAAAFAAAASLPLVTVNDYAGRLPVGTVQPNGNARSEIAGDPLDNAREAGGTLYGYRV